jgi:hypothetical protein
LIRARGRGPRSDPGFSVQPSSGRRCRFRQIGANGNCHRRKHFCGHHLATADQPALTGFWLRRPILPTLRSKKSSSKLIVINFPGMNSLQLRLSDFPSCTIIVEIDWSMPSERGGSPVYNLTGEPLGAIGHTMLDRSSGRHYAVLRFSTRSAAVRDIIRCRGQSSSVTLGWAATLRISISAGCRRQSTGISRPQALR